jgi:hypothetical protein
LVSLNSAAPLERAALLSATEKALIKVTTAKKAIKIKTSLRMVPPFIITLTLFIEYFKGVYGPFVLINGKMKVRTGTPAGTAHPAYDGTLVHINAVLYQNAA